MMAYKYREEIVGKRFLSVSGFTKLKLGKINEWGWRSGVIRAASHKDNKHKDLQVLVEYDDVEWHRREWISIYKDSLFHFFLVEQALVWSDRKDPFSSHSGTVLWPALTFQSLVSTVDISAQSQPVEFLLDRELAFKDYSLLEPFLEWDAVMATGKVRDYPELRAEVRRWAELQDGQRILLTTPSVLVGYRVEVYRAEGTTQWYTAVIVGYNEATRDLTVTDDTVLEEHNEDPSLVQMRLIGDGVVESIMRGENVGITPRRSRSALLQTQQQPSRVARSSTLLSGNGGGSTTGASRNHGSGVSQAAPHRKQRQQRPPASTPHHNQPQEHHSPADTDEKGGKGQRKRKCSENDVIKSTVRKEDLENKQGRKSTRNCVNRGAKKKVLEEANNSKLRQHVRVRVEDCLQNGQRLSALCRRPSDESEETNRTEVENPRVQEEDSSDSSRVEVEEPVVETPTVSVEEVKDVESVDKEEITIEEKTEERREGEVSEEDDCVIVSEEKRVEEVREEVNKVETVVEVGSVEEDTRTESEAVCSSRDDDDGALSSSSPFGRMELGDGCGTVSLLRFPDDRSDSGVSSLRSGSCASGDERSGSRSSALSSSDEPQQQQQTQQSVQQTPASTRSPVYAPPASAAPGQPPPGSRDGGPVRVWRDPSLLLESEPHVRHIQSVQHQSLLMSHPAPPPSTASAPSSTSAAAAAAAAAALAHYPTVVPPPPPALLSHLPPHALAAHHLAPHPQTLYSQLSPDMLRGYQRYQPVPIGAHLMAPQGVPPADDLLERERSYAQERDRQERIHRERREQEVREMEKQHKEREQQQKERERMERDRQEREKQAEREREREKQERERQDRLERDQERDRQEKQRAAEQAVHKHFEESLRLAQQKRERNPWGNVLPLSQRSGTINAIDEERKRVDQEHQLREQQRQAERLARERAYYNPINTQRPPSVPSKADYPPPAHSRVSNSKPTDKLSVGHATLPKAEPNMKLFSYSTAYQPTGFVPHDPKYKMDHHKQSSQQNSGLVVSKSSNSMALDRDRDIVLPNPPPLMSEIKNSVIVKHEVKSPHHLEPKVSVAHSPSPKLRDMSQHYIQTSQSQSHKSGMYDYRSPTQSPLHLQQQQQQHPHAPSPHHHLEPQNLGKAHQSHHRSSSQLPSPHHQRQSPHQHSHQQQHPSNQDIRYSRSDTPNMMYPGSVKTTVAGSYSYMPPNSLGTVVSPYALTVGTPAGKPKVSSPAPPHMYGKPTAGIGSGIPVSRVQEATPPSNPLPLTKSPLGSSISPSPYQPVSQYHIPNPHQQQQMTSCPPPPPAHSRPVEPRCLYERLYPPANSLSSGLPVKQIQHHGTSPPTATAAPSPISRSPHLPSHMSVMPLSVHNSGVNAGAVQTQPLDLGVSDRNVQRDDGMSSPKRKGTPLSQPIALDVKKRKLESPSGLVQQQMNLSSQPQLARVSEPSPLIASAATTITTVVNTAAYRPPTTTIILPQNHPEVIPDVSVTAVTTEVPRCSSNPPVNSPTPPVPVPNVTTNSSPVSSPATVVTTAASTVTDSTPSTPVKVALTPSVVDSEKSNSPGPVKSSSSSNYPVRHLKKAWLQRHTGEDIEDTTGVIGSGTCVSLPIPIVTNSTPPAKETTPVSSLHTIGSMAVNSINKTKAFTVKGNARKGNATKEVGTVNGHGTDPSKNDDSSSSDQERGRKSPPKRKPPKVKRKKGGGNVKKTITEDIKKRKVTAAQSAAASESGSDSDKESGSEKDSDSGASTNQTSGKKAANGGSNTTSTNNKDKEPRKRGRRPKSSKNDKGEEPRNKKSRDEPSLPQRDPFRKPPVGQLKKTGESFLQDGPCFEVAPKLAKCRECRWTPNQRSKNMPNIFCRFYAFRRLRYTKNGQLAIAGFSDPHKDALEEDLKLWLPLSDNPPSDLDLEMSRLLLKQVGDHFCDLLIQERDAIGEHMSDDKTIAWKRVVQGVREMCDVCETTLFNFHWACGKCGFVVCLDCYKGRKNGSLKMWGESRKDRDECSWLLCTNRQAHEQEKLMLTQIIAGDSLIKLGKKVHEYREMWGIPQYCGCNLSKETKSMNGAYKDIIKSLIKGELNGIKNEKKDEDEKPLVNGASVKEEKKSPLIWLADVALSNEDKKADDSSDSDGEKDGSFSTLRELLIRPSHKSNGSRATSPNTVSNNTSNNGLTKPVKKSRMDTLDEVISSVIEDTVQKSDDLLADVKPVELKHFVRRYNWQSKGREPLPIRIMTCTESKILYPDTPHSWLCDGKLLRLTDPANGGNYRVFQDQWKRGQPVIVSNVTRNLDSDLWHPDSFIRDFGDEKNDLINCMTGNLVPNQPMRKFWEGFEHFSKRLKDERGNPMLLKLKDWPPGEDFAELMPTRFNDLMKVLPLSEYTHRSGRLNLASRLPECFVRPDLGPKMYNAYGSALYPTKGTTNLHLDISDAVNVMVYVGIPKDGDNDEHIKEAFRAIDEAGCDILTRRRVRDKDELPGALWHIYNARDADKIRDLLNKVAIEKGARLEPHHDPIHDQSWYLDGPLRERLYKEYGVEGYAIVQCRGDSVFIPAGAPHQVRNLHNCIKVAEDFVSPENVSHCFHLTQEFRELSDTHTNHEDKLQIKNIIYHAVKDSLSVLSSLLNNHIKVKSELDEDDDKKPGDGKSGVSGGQTGAHSSSSSDSNSPTGSPASQDTDSTKEQV